MAFQMFLLLPIVILGASFLPADALLSPFCRCLEGDSCFPSEQAWSDFNTRIDGRLVQVRPPAYPCYSLGYGTEGCAQARSRWQNSIWRSSQPGAAEHPNWERYNGKGCSIPGVNADPHAQLSTANCSQGSVPIYAVNASNYLDVQQAVFFATRHNLRLVIKNTGHDYMGKSTARGSLSIWTHHMKSIVFTDDFRASGALDQETGVPAVTIGAGVQTTQLVEAADNQSVVVVCALSATVGSAGGYFQGGGHSVLSPAYGLAADNVIEFSIVTADGAFRTANKYQNQELFWAVRGGGGGTFGVVISVTFLTHPAPQNFLAANYVVEAKDHASVPDLLQQLAAVSPSLTDSGWGGYFTVIGEISSPLLLIRYVTPNRQPGFAASNFGPFLSYVRASSNLRLVSEAEQSYDTFYQWFQESLCSFYASNQCVDLLGINRALVTRLVPRSTMEQSSGELASAMVNLLQSTATTGRVLGIHVGGGAVSVKHNNSVNPAWRNAVWHLTAEANWDEDTNQAAIDSIMAGLTDANAALRQLTPTSGVYINEADYNEPKWQQSIFGDVYNDLLAVKRYVDPANLFICWHCVGSENATLSRCTL